MFEALVLAVIVVIVVMAVAVLVVWIFTDLSFPEAVNAPFEAMRSWTRYVRAKLPWLPRWPWLPWK
jgi:hypothetical protein